MQPSWPAAHIFVAHSMRGLVVKKAYVLGKYGGEYGDIMSKTQGIIFLATQHRGACYAKMLNNILCTTPFCLPPKVCITCMDIHARMPKDMREQFWNQQDKCRV